MRLWPFRRRKEQATLTVFDGHRAIFEWEFSAQAEKTITSAAGVIRQYANADVLLVKAMDGPDWMARWDTSPAAISSAASLDAAVAEGQAAGVTVIPWVVPHGLSDAQEHGALGPTLVVDLEPYTSFWTDTPGNVAPYLAALTAAGVRNLFVSIDPRPSATTLVDLDSWAHTVAGLLPQTYWTDFQRPYSESVAYVQTLMGYGVPVYPVIPFDGSPSDVSGFWQACLALGCTACSLWRLGSANGSELQTFGQLPVKKPVVLPSNDDNIQMVRLLLQPDLPALVAYAQKFI